MDIFWNLIELNETFLKSMVDKKCNTVHALTLVNTYRVNKNVFHALWTHIPSY